MSQTCPRCNAIIADGERFCPACGVSVASSAPPLAQNDNPYNQGTNNTFAQPTQYAQPAYQEPVMTLGSWVGTIVVTNLFGIISLIFLFVWGFDRSQPIAKQNYCKAMLIFRAILLGVGIILGIFFTAMFVSTAGSIVSAIEESGYNWSDIGNAFENSMIA